MQKTKEKQNQTYAKRNGIAAKKKAKQVIKEIVKASARMYNSTNELYELQELYA